MTLVNKPWRCKPKKATSKPSTTYAITSPCLPARNRQIVLHDMIEKRYALRPYGWPDDEVLLLVARLLVLGEISLMMDGALVPLDKAYDALTTPAKRRKIVVLKRQTTDPKPSECPQSWEGCVS